jgi:hypothetical protein
MTWKTKAIRISKALSHLVPARRQETPKALLLHLHQRPPRPPGANAAKNSKSADYRPIGAAGSTPRLQ